MSRSVERRVQEYTSDGATPSRRKRTAPRQFVMTVTQMSFDFRAHVAQNIEQAGDIVQSFSEHNMPAYEICYLDETGALTYKFSATCDDDQRAKILAHAMKLPSAKKLEVWAGEALIYTRPSAVLESHLLRAS